PVLPLVAAPLDRRADVADRRVEPDVEDLVLRLVERDGHAPVEVARHDPGAQVELVLVDLALDVVLPARERLGEVRLELWTQFRQIDVPVARVAEDGRRAARLALRVLDAESVERRAAARALVAARAVELADVARPRHEAIGEALLVLLAVELLVELIEDVAVLLEREEEL